MGIFLDKAGLSSVWSKITANFVARSTVTAKTTALSWGAESEVANIDGKSIKVSLPASPSHQSLGLIVASSASGTAESGTRDNTHTFVNLLGGGALKDSVQFTGSGSVSVSGANGQVTITGTDTNTAALVVADGKLSTSESPSSQITFTGGTNQFTITDGSSNTITVQITPSISGGVTGSGLTANAIVLGNGNSAVKTSSKTITETLGSDNTTVPTSGAVAAAISNALTSVMAYVGTSTTAITDGGTENPTISGYSGTAKTKGNVVLYDGKEFVWTGSAWEQLGDESSFALKTISITGTGALGGGGTLTESRSITHNTVLTTGSADTTYGPTANVSGANAINVPTIKLDSYGHVKEIGTYTYTGPTVPTVNNGRLQLKGTDNSLANSGFTANGSDATITFAKTGGSISSIIATAGTVTINGVDSLKNPSSLTIGTKPSTNGTATNTVVYDGSEGKTLYFSTANASTTNVKFAIDSNNFITGTVTAVTPGNAALKVASNTGTATQAITMNDNTTRTLTIKGEDSGVISGTVSGSSNAAVITLTHSAHGNIAQAGTITSPAVTPDFANDFVLISDASASGKVERVTFDSLALTTAEIEAILV